MVCAASTRLAPELKRQQKAGARGRPPRAHFSPGSLMPCDLHQGLLLQEFVPKMGLGSGPVLEVECLLLQSH